MFKPPTEPNNMVQEHRLGTFFVSQAMLQASPEFTLANLFENFLVVRAEHCYHPNPAASVTKYWAYSRLFDPGKPGELTPEYKVEIHQSGSDGDVLVTVERQPNEDDLRREIAALKRQIGDAHAAPEVGRDAGGVPGALDEDDGSTLP